MKPDRVDVAAMEPVVALDAEPAVGVAPLVEGQEQALPTSQTEEVGQEKAGTPTVTTEVDKDKPADLKAKTKAPTKKTATTKPSTASRPTTAQNRLTNGVQKPQTNGVAKKTPGVASEKKTPTNVPPKKPAGAATTKTTTKAAEKKPASTTRPATVAANGTKTTSTAPALKKTTVTSVNGDKAKPKTTAPRPSTAPAKPSTTSSPKTVSKTTRPATGSTTSRPSPAAPKPATTAASKTSASTSASKPSPSTAKTTTKPSPAKTTAPPAGRVSTPSSKTTTPIKKDVSKPLTPVAKKQAASPLTRPASTKTTKVDTPKATTTAKPESASKKPSSPTKPSADAKTSKPKESKPAPSKEVSASPRTPSAKNSTTKTTNSKKPVGSSTPMPVKRGPKVAPAAEPTPKEGEKKDVAPTTETAPIVDTLAAATAVAVAAAAAVTAADTLTREAASEPEVQAEPVSELASEPKSELPPESKSELAPEPRSESLLETVSELAPEFNVELLPEPKSEPAPEHHSEFQLETKSELADTAPLETECELYPESRSALLPEPEQTPEPEIVTEPEIPKTITTATEEMTQEAEDIPAGTEEETPEDKVPQLPAELDVDCFKELTSAATSLGTTVMSPPSSPTRASAVLVEAQITAPLLDMYPPVNTRAESQSMFSDGLSPESLEQEMKPQEEHLTAAKCEEEGIGKPFSLAEEPNLLSTSPVEHFSGASPASPSFEKEEAVEKAEEEINEDDHYEEEEEEEEEEEKEEMELVKPEAPQVDEFNIGLSEFGGSGWGMMHSGGTGSLSQQQEKTEMSPSLMGSHCAVEGADDFSLKKMEMETSHSLIESHPVDEDDDFCLKNVETQQPFMGPPGIKSFSDEEEEEEEEEELKEDTGIVSTVKCHMDFGLEQAGSHHTELHLHHKSEEEDEHEDEDDEMFSKGPMDRGIKSAENVDGDEYEVGYMDSLNRNAPAPSMPTAEAWGLSNPFAAPNLFNNAAVEPEKSLADAWLEQPLGHLQTQRLGAHEEMESSVPADSSNLCAPAVGMSQSSTLSGAALAAHSSSETSTPEELRDYDSSSGVESRSDKQQTPVPPAQPDLEQDLGIHLERGDGEEEEAETLPADDVLGDAPTAPVSAPSSPSTSGDEASDTEGEMQINDPDAPVDVAFDSPSASRNLPALEEDEEAADLQAGEEDGGGTPQSANSVASYGFDCSASNSNAHSTAESCGKSPGIFSLENEDQLTEEAKDPSLIKELTLPAAAAHPEELLGCPVDLLPLGQQGESHLGLDDEYLLCGKTGAGALEEADPESPMHLSPQHRVGTDSQPPYYSAVCDKTDSFLAGHDNLSLVNRLEVKSAGLPSLTREANDNCYLPPVQNSHRQHKPQQLQPAGLGMELVKLPVDPPNGQLRRLEQHQLQLHHIQERHEQERQQRLWLEGARQRLELQRQLRLRQEQERRMRQAKERQWLELQRQQQCKEEERQHLELQRQQKRQQLEHQRQRQGEKSHWLKLQRQHQEEDQKQLELQRQRQQEEQMQLVMQRQQEERQQLELQRKRQEEERKQLELERLQERKQLELQRQRQEEERKRLELQRQKERQQLELQRQQERQQLELQRQQERQQLELQRQQERQQLELQRQLQQEEKQQLELQKQQEKQQLELHRQRQEEERKQFELQRQQDRQQLELQRQWQKEERQENEKLGMELQKLQRQRQEEERQRLEQQNQLERQRRELLQLQLHQEQQEHRQRRQLLQWQMELEQQFRLNMQQQLKAPSPSSALCTIYEAMETSEDEDEERVSLQELQAEIPLRAANGNLRRPPPRELDWNTKVDMVQQLINQALLLEGEDGCPPLLYLPGQGGGILSPLESSLWPHILPQLNPTSATITSVSSYSPTSQGNPPQGDWTVVELETHH